MDQLQCLSGRPARDRATHVTPAYGYSGYYGYRAGLYNIPFVGFGEMEETVHYKVGTANIDVVDARKKQLIWVAIAEGRLTDAMMNSPDDSIAKIVSDMFAQVSRQGGKTMNKQPTQGRALQMKFTSTAFSALLVAALAGAALGDEPMPPAEALKDSVPCTEELLPLRRAKFPDAGVLR